MEQSEARESEVRRTIAYGAFRSILVQAGLFTGTKEVFQTHSLVQTRKNTGFFYRFQCTNSTHSDHPDHHVDHTPRAALWAARPFCQIKRQRATSTSTSTRKSSPRATEALRQDFALHKYRRERLRKDRRRLLSLTDRAWRYANKA
ncbi:hypothetical protein PC113_g19060 [Phytophthora cactorum]|uniref:Uncharacterized protein n=2 Tax=Phytophthora cactorum TaxID=29920 RepID=A0A8T0Y791_9STRA|nr:hypothetical protein PC113_g19060 [Phytophthora cactorum]